MILSFVFLGVLAAPNSVAQAITSKPNAEEALIAIVDRKDVAGLHREFPKIHGDDGSSFPAYSPEAVMTWLSGCKLDKRTKFGGSYMLDYACPARRKLAKGCDTGDLGLTTGDYDRTLVVTQKRKSTLDCPPFAPIAPLSSGKPNG